ncbi:hypothetical protein ACIA8K_05660 [Catenuloplanes sp. NPDC051500]|uniref:hypothetical protein n=1 Tax=Catenuloplanes sp. NPDC051500 TaxID=3363959 RepID=UPI003799B6D5
MTKDPQHDDGDNHRVWSKIDLVKLSAGTLAAISSAVCASWLGVTGTIVGAALASVVATVGQEIYAHSLKRAHKRLQGVRLEQALTAVGATGRLPLQFTRPAAAPTPRSGGGATSAAAMASGGFGTASASAGSDSGPAWTGVDPADTGVRDSDEEFVVLDRRASSRSATDGADSSGGSPSDSATSGEAASDFAASGRTASGETASDRASADREASGGAGADATQSDARARFGAEPGDGEPATEDGDGNRAHWVRLALAAVAMFVFAMLAIHVFELVAGDSLAGLFGDSSAGATTLPFGGGDPDPASTPVPPTETLPAGQATIAPSDTPQSSAPAGTPAATDSAPATGTEPQPDATNDPVAPPAGDEAPVQEAPAADDAPIG